MQQNTSGKTAFTAKRHSLVFQITMGVILLATLLLTVLALSNMYSYRVVTRNTLSTFEAGSSLYVSNINDNLKTVTKSIAELAKASITNMQLYVSQTPIKKYLLQVDWLDLLIKRMDFTDAVDFLFIVHPIEGLNLVASSKRAARTIKISAIDYLSKQKEYANDALSEQWHVVTIGGMPCLMQTFKVAGFYIGGIVQFSTLFENLPKALLQKEVQYLLTDGQGNILHTYGEKYMDIIDKIENGASFSTNYRGKWFLLTEDLQYVRLTMARPNDAIYLGLEFSFWLILGFGILCFALIIAGSYYIYSQIVKPVNELFMGTKQIEKGNLSYRVKEYESPQEFAALTKSFNSMTKEIVTLKIESYESEIQRQQNELRFLHMQIRPHFYLNAITTISSFAYQNRSDALKSYTEALSKYMRYLFKEGGSQTTIAEEAAHANAFISLSQLKNPGHIYAMINISPQVQNIAIPKYLILTLVENIMKHAYRQDKMLTIFLQAGVETLEEKPYVHILAEDNGPGFTEAFWEAFPYTPTDADKRIGLNNLHHMLVLNYKSNNLMRISNAPSGGAKVDIYIPVKEEEIHALTDCR